jgi:FkbM family methyltransferase
MGSPLPTINDKLEAWRVLTGLTIRCAFEKNTDGIKKFKLFGYSVNCYRYSTLLYLFRDIFMRSPYRFEHSNDKPVIIDCGANIGMSILYFKKCWPGSRVIAFEPNPHVFQLLEKNMQENNLTGVEINNQALCDNEDIHQFYINEDKGTLKGSLLSNRGGATSFEVKGRRLSGVLASAHPDLVKMDVEGAELSIIKELFDSNTLGYARQYIIEYHHQIDKQKPLMGDFLKKFEVNEYDYNIRSNYGVTGEFQDIMINLVRRAN